LHQRGGSPVFRVIALQTFREGDNHRAVEICVFAVTLLRAPPTRVAPQIGVGRSDYDSALLIFRTLKDVTSFVAFDFAGLSQDVGVPGFTEPNALREGR